MSVKTIQDVHRQSKWEKKTLVTVAFFVVLHFWVLVV